MPGFGVPKPAVKGNGQLVLTVNTFGLPRTARYGMTERSHEVARLDELTVGEVYGVVRSASHAIRIAAANGAERDLKIAIVKIQRAAAELARRSTKARLEVQEDTRDTDPVWLYGEK